MVQQLKLEGDEQLRSLLAQQGLDEVAIAQLVGQLPAIKEAQERRQKEITYDDLTESQRSACDGIVNFILGPRQEPEKILTGYAGTGKTTVIAIAVKRALEQSEDLKRSDILLAGPTHKACGVIEQSFQSTGLGIEADTYAAMLGMRSDFDKNTGEEFFRPDPGAPESFSKHSIVIADEGSQASRSLKALIDDRVGLFQRIIWIGDRAQLPPIEDPPEDLEGMHESPVFKLPGWDLTEVVRYNGGLAHFAEAIRMNLEAETPPSPLDYADDKTVFTRSPATWRADLLKRFKTDEFIENPDSLRVLAWRNKTVAVYNDLIHRARYGDNAPEFCPGETVVATKPCLEEPRVLGVPPVVLLPNGAEATIDSAQRGVWLEIPVWFLECVTSLGREIRLRVVSKEGQSCYQRKVQGLKRTAVQNKGSAWAKYFNFLEEFHPISLAPALSVHKSQGSTFENVFVDNSDISMCRGDYHRRVLSNKLSYVAATRASNSALFKA